MGDDLRKRELATIHMAKAALGMTDDEYRDVMFAVTRVRSAAELDWTGRKRLIDHFRKLGFKPRASRPMAADKQSRYIRALWLDLAQAGLVRDASEAALAAYVKRMTGRDALQWLTVAEKRTVIEALKSWLSRRPDAAA